MMTEKIFKDLKFKNILYTPKLKNGRNPVFYYDKISQVYILKCFIDLKSAEIFVQFLKDSSTGSDLETESFAVEDIFKFAKAVTPQTDKPVTVEVWGTKGDIDIGPLILYNSTELLN